MTCISYKLSQVSLMVDANLPFQQSTIIHELCHAVGLYHTQSRSDRDNHVDVLEGNVIPRYLRNFRRMDTENFDSPYDFYSVMHYGPTVSEVWGT